MPDGWPVAISAVGTLIVILLAIIGYLIKTGLDGIRQEIHDLWQWAKGSDDDRKWLHEQIASINSRCFERHESGKGDRRSTDI